MSKVIESVCDEWEELQEDYKQLEINNAAYLKKVEELTKLQDICRKHIAHQKYRLNIMQKNLKGISEDKNTKQMKENIMKREVELQYMEQSLPKKSDRYMLKLILGDIDVSFFTKENKFRYKEDYETFKLISHCVAFTFSLILYFYEFRPLEKFFMGFLVWYYCTISIRESILKVNGSRIKGWWRIHHLLSIVSSGLLLVWPYNEPWKLFRKHFINYTIYSAFIQYLQFKYQKGTLYRLKALGEMQNMDITAEGFHSWMWRGLTFLLPFLFIGYIFQLSNAIILFNLSYLPEASWEVTCLSLIFLTFFLGNSYTTLGVIPMKTKKNMLIRYKILRSKVYDAISETVMGSHRDDEVIVKESSKDS
ncbi:transmembrane protein 120 homolog [Diorhabda sublineata]|uniref:transmembrane protein 120 homolog n=1 Tax=Diorhabda sublineata TaxID=1163346 RepID=UPI0024E10DF2|nr:transmembrane protein 120 homolog [Diorhabda sublineata]